MAFPHVPGSDVAGVVEETHSPFFNKGDAVVVNPAIPCGKCDGEQADPDACKFVNILGVHKAGGYASMVSVPDGQLYRVPPGMSVTEAAAFPLDYLTAWRMLVTKAGLEPGESILIWGASGSLGCAAVTIAKSLGAVVIVAAGSEDAADQLSAIWNHHVVLYKTEDVCKAVRALTGGQGADCVFESVGASTFETSMNSVRPHGRIVICGTRSGHLANINLEDLYYNQIRIFGSRMGNRAEFKDVLSQVSQESWKPIIAAEFPLDDVREAHGFLENRTRIGKVILRHD